mmetsp:Transcript_62878/g.146401  ORF Transcript_62878/g.146401 Transcript_62878/m.146401 type:complete len:112 (+) Transcript_62878:369-704(+)
MSSPCESSQLRRTARKLMRKANLYRGPRKPQSVVSTTGSLEPLRHFAPVTICTTRTALRLMHKAFHRGPRKPWSVVSTTGSLERLRHFAAVMIHTTRTLRTALKLMHEADF